MRSRTELILYPSATGISAVKFETPDNDPGNLVIRQGDDVILLPRADVTEFCRQLGEWEASQPAAVRAI
jgi:hypothetical protein